MTEYERQKVRDLINGMTDEEKEIAAEILEKWKSKIAEEIPEGEQGRGLPDQVETGCRQ